MSAHTPGPWKIQDMGPRVGYPLWRHYCIRHAESNVHIASVGNVDRYYEGSEGANASLIAAAPEMLAALKAWIVAYECGELERYDDAWKAARSAIARAEGR